MHGANKVGVGVLVSCRNLVRLDEDHGVLAHNCLGTHTMWWKTSCTAAPFICKQLSSKGRVGAIEKRVHCFCATCGGIVHFAGNGRIMLNGLGKLDMVGESTVVMACKERWNTRTGSKMSGRASMRLGRILCLESCTLGAEAGVGAVVSTLGADAGDAGGTLSIGTFVAMETDAGEAVGWMSGTPAGGKGILSRLVA